MDVVRLKILRDVIAALDPSRFDMARLFTTDGFSPGLAKTIAHNCDTAACIAGWAGVIFLPETSLANISGSYAGQALDLTYQQQHALFCPPNYRCSSQYTQAAAVRTLDHLIETGEVKWN